MQIQASVRYHYIPTRIPKSKRTVNAKCSYKCETIESLIGSYEYILGLTILENCWQYILKLTYTTP